MKKKIAFFELEKWEEDYIKKNLKGFDLKFFSEMSGANLKKARDCDAVAVFIYSEVSHDMLNNFRNLKFVTTMSTGFDHIDLEACKKKGIEVANVPRYGENTVAEHAFALILNLARNVDDASARTRKGNFDLDGLMGTDVCGKTLGVIGGGNIGQHLIRMARGFEMNVLVYDRKGDPKLAKRLGFRYSGLDGLLRKSDFVSVHLPLLDSTRQLIDKTKIRIMKKGSFLVNTSRGEVVDTGALLWGLDKGILAGAGLDVLEGEDEIKEERQLLHRCGKQKGSKLLKENIRLLKDKKVIITPHSAFYSKEAVERILDNTVRNIKGYFGGKKYDRVV